MDYEFFGCNVVDLAKEFGTPLYVMSEDKILEEINTVKKIFNNKYKNAETYYASKAFLTKDMIRIIKNENLGLDVVSGGELYGAINLDFPSEKIMFHGNGKTKQEIEMAIDYNVGLFVSDSYDEIKIINEIASKKNTVQNILIRITPGVNTDTHKHISTAMKDSKFGIPLDTIINVVEETLKLKNINLQGFHFHVGSQLLNNKSHIMSLEIVLKKIKQLKEEINFETKILNLGGGFGIYYNKNEQGKNAEYFVAPMMEMIQKFCLENNHEFEKIIIEPGRKIVGEAGITLYTVQNIKEIPDIRTYVSVDGGMFENIRPALYEAVYELEVGNKFNEEKINTVSISGKCCESSDILIKDAKVPNLEIGDILVIKSTGAYNFSMASRYNKNPVPALVMIKNGKARLSVKRETFNDLYKNEI